MKGQTQRRLRQLHNWFGLFFAPAILFFALTGVIQTLGFQDKSPGYTPPGWINLVSSLHKDQVVPDPQPAPDSKMAETPAKAAAPDAAQKPADGDHHHKEGSVPLKAFVLLLGAVLSISTLLGICIAFANPAARRRSTILLLAGLIIPLAFILL